MAYYFNFNNDNELCLHLPDVTYTLREVTLKELRDLRLSERPGLVYKTDNKFYYSAVDGTLRPYSYFPVHLCGAQCARVCDGCPRTRDLTVSYQERFGKEFYDAVKASWRIEKYSFISEGFEFFNMLANNDSLVIVACSAYEHKLPREPERNAAFNTRASRKLELANFLWPDFDGTYEELKLRIAANKAKN